ncbi:MAG: hypothetical protein NT157_04345, partial [Candidatus Micrarchaeota archaeon]|nr:hypothetical protein [Candidatus Micrarchaeota archaeon]
EVHDSIISNIRNIVAFKLNREDATTISSIMEIKVEEYFKKARSQMEIEESKKEMFVRLHQRECIVRLFDGKKYLLPMKLRVVDAKKWGYEPGPPIGADQYPARPPAGGAGAAIKPEAIGKGAPMPHEAAGARRPEAAGIHGMEALKPEAMGTGGRGPEAAGTVSQRTVAVETGIRRQYGEPAPPPILRKSDLERRVKGAEASEAPATAESRTAKKTEKEKEKSETNANSENAKQFSDLESLTERWNIASGKSTRDAFTFDSKRRKKKD